MKRTNIILWVCGILFVVAFVVFQIHDHRYWAGYYSKEEFYYPSNDLPTVEKSNAAYLLDPNLSINEENIVDCIDDYFSAPSILYYSFDLSGHDELLLTQNERATEFTDVFRNVSMTQLLESYPLPLKGHDNSFENVIGRITIWEERGDTYMLFSRTNELVQDESCFCISGQTLVPELNRIAASLEDVSEEPPRNTDLPH
ncbi:MAG: hypothetical protein ACOX7K_08280 [Oscillospiraceae bacterium]